MGSMKLNLSDVTDDVPGSLQLDAASCLWRERPEAPGGERRGSRAADEATSSSYTSIVF